MYVFVINFFLYNDKETNFSGINYLITDKEEFNEKINK